MEVVGENMDGIEGQRLILLLLRGGGRTSTRIGIGIDGGTYRTEVMGTGMEMAPGGKMIEIENLDEASTVNTTKNQDQGDIIIQAENLFEECLPGTKGTKGLAILLIEVGRS